MRRHFYLLYLCMKVSLYTPSTTTILSFKFDPNPSSGSSEKTLNCSPFLRRQRRGYKVLSADPGPSARFQTTWTTRTVLVARGFPPVKTDNGRGQMVHRYRYHTIFYRLQATSKQKNLHTGGCSIIINTWRKVKFQWDSGGEICAQRGDGL